MVPKSFGADPQVGARQTIQNRALAPNVARTKIVMVLHGFAQRNLPDLVLSNVWRVQNHPIPISKSRPGNTFQNRHRKSWQRKMNRHLMILNTSLGRRKSCKILETTTRNVVPGTGSAPRGCLTNRTGCDDGQQVQEQDTTHSPTPRHRKVILHFLNT